MQGCFVFGFDHDDASVFESTVQLVQDLGVDIPRYSLYTPYPGTPLFQRLLAEDRILSFNWNDYDTMHVVIKPVQMTPEELYRGFKWAYKETFRLDRVLKRVSRPDIRCAINFVGNLAYRIFVKRLYSEPRFATPYSVQDPGSRAIARPLAGAAGRGGCRMPGLMPTSVRNSSFHFDVATPADEPALREFGRSVDMPGAVRFSFEREPDYFGALCVEGHQSEVLVCRETRTGRVRATGHRSIKPVFVNGQPMSVGYLSGLRLEEPVRNGRILGRGYHFLRERHGDGRTLFYLTTIMEDNRHAKAALLSGRCGLPQYHDFGRFCCMAISLNSRGAGRVDANLRVRNAVAGDASTIITLLQGERRSRQFFPEYQAADFGTVGGLLSHLNGTTSSWGSMAVNWSGSLPPGTSG